MFIVVLIGVVNMTYLARSAGDIYLMEVMDKRHVYKKHRRKVGQYKHVCLGVCVMFMLVSNVRCNKLNMWVW